MLIFPPLSATCHNFLNLVCLPPQLLGYCRSFDIVLPVRDNYFPKFVFVEFYLKDCLTGLFCFFPLLVPDQPKKRCYLKAQKLGELAKCAHEVKVSFLTNLLLFSVSLFNWGGLPSNTNTGLIL